MAAHIAQFKALRVKHWVDSVPCCDRSTSIALAADLLRQSSSDRLIVIDAAQHPIALLQGHQVFSHIGSAEVCLDALLITPDAPRVMPWVSGDQCVGELDFETRRDRFWVVVDADEKVLGVVDSFYLRKMLSFATLSQETNAPSLSPVDAAVSPSIAPAKAALLANTSESLWHQVKAETTTADTSDPMLLETLRLKQQLRLQMDQLRAQVQAQSTPPGLAGRLGIDSLGIDSLGIDSLGIDSLGIDSLGIDSLGIDSLMPESSSLALRSLMQFLERLPLPLMLQTSGGTVIARNGYWTDQLRELTDPQWVQRDAAAVLEFAIPPGDLLSDRSTGPSAYVDRLPPVDRLALDSTPGSIQTLEGAEDTSESEVLTRLCHIGSSPDTCICVCPLKNGQERIVQFIKIPLGSLVAESDARSRSSNWSQSFKLARLENTELQTSAQTDTERMPSDEWRSLHPPSQIPTPEHQLEHNLEHNLEQLWLVLAQDVTEQHQLTRELSAKNADLIQLNRLKDEFLACISHELRTPLTAVLGLSGLLKDQLSGSMSERQVRYAQLIHRSGRHLMTIVNDILDLTRIETGQLDLTFEPVGIATVCDRAFEQAQKLCLEEEKQEVRSIASDPIQLPQFRCDLEPGINTLVADEQRLRQMLVHLLSNALKFTPATGTIGLKVTRWEGWLAFTVWDTGIGIAPDKQHLIFQKFQQLENPLTRRFEGVGLGLVLTQRLARLHGGDISFTSQENQGSQFTLLLPPTHPQPTIALGGSIQTHADRNRLVLVVEAVVRSIDTLSDHLSDLGYRTVIARSGTDAIEKARRLQPCAVFINPLLPTLSGWDVLTLLKADPQTRQIPVVMTGTRSDREQAYRNQADGFLSLPITKKPLQQALRQLTQDQTAAASPPDPVNSLVVLHLNPNSRGETASSSLNLLLHSHNYRVLEADDLDQADLLAQVWKPNVVVLPPAVTDPMEYLNEVGKRTFLAALPLVTLDTATTQAANQVAGLSVFPCLAPLVEQSVSAGGSEVAAVLQVIQVAAGFAWRPLVLAIDAAVLLDKPNSRDSEWLQALMQYVQTAGFRGILARSRSEVLQKLQTQSVNLLLIHWHDDLTDPASQSAWAELQALPDKPAVLVIDHLSTHRSPDAASPFTHSDGLNVKVLPPLPMETLLGHVNEMIMR